MDFDYLCCKTVCETTGLPTSTLYAKIAAGEFPKPVKLGKRAVGWLSTDIDNWKRKSWSSPMTDPRNTPALQPIYEGSV